MGRVEETAAFVVGTGGRDGGQKSWIEVSERGDFEEGPEEIAAVCIVFLIAVWVGCPDNNREEVCSEKRLQG